MFNGFQSGWFPIKLEAHRKEALLFPSFFMSLCKVNGIPGLMGVGGIPSDA